MKRLRYAFLLSAALAVSAIQTKEAFKVILEAKWQNLQNDPQKIELFGGKWILAGSITFKKKSSEIIFLDQIQLTWKGEPIAHLIGSLYEKNDTSSFLPIEKYLVCDSQWKKSTQQLLMEFKEPLTLGAVNTFYLVLTVPEKIEQALKNGEFHIEQTGLPLRYREYVKNKHLSIALDDLHKSSNRT